MCEEVAFTNYMERLEDYLEYVNTDVEDHLDYPLSVYAAYGSRNGESVETIKEWYEAADEQYLDMFAPTDYIDGIYGNQEADYFWELVYREESKGYIYRYADHWFMEK